MAQSKNDRFPSQIKYIVGNEACERFSFYGMRSILVIYMTKYLLMADNHAGGAYHFFISAAYFLPLLGGFIADRYLGKYRTILYFSVVYCIGHAVLALGEGSMSGMYWGLGLIALGTGAIKPCVSAHVGDQFTEKNKHLLAKVFDWFYFSVNFGAFFSGMLIPWILPKYGPGWAFGLPGILMGLATIVFWMGRNLYVHVPPTRNTGEVGFMAILTYSLRHLGQKKAGQSVLDIARAKYSKESVEAAKAAADIFKLYILVSFFWALFDQQGSSWTLQAEKMDRHFFGFVLESSQVQSWNPIMVLILIPIFSKFVYPAIEKLGVAVTPLRKMSVGMLLAGLSFVVIAIAQSRLDAGYVVNVSWQVLAYLILTMSEIMVSITGLEFSYTQSPRSMKSTIMSFWLLTVTVGDLIAGVVTELNKYQGATFFMFFAVIMFVVAVVFALGASRFKVREYIEDTTPGLPEGAPA